MTKYDDKPIREDCLHQPGAEWRDQRPSIGEICRMTVERYTDGDDDERRALRRELDEEAEAERREERDDRNHWGQRMPFQPHAIWWGDPAHDPR